MIRLFSGFLDPAGLVLVLIDRDNCQMLMVAPSAAPFLLLKLGRVQNIGIRIALTYVTDFPDHGSAEDHDLAKLLE